MDKYTENLISLLPKGVLWACESSTTLYKLLDALAQELQRVEDLALELIEEADPRTTTNLLDDWERVAGLPSDCWTPTTEADRRTALVAKLATRGSQALQFYVDQAALIGYDVLIERHPYSPFVAGSLCGTPIWGNEWRFVIRMIAFSGDQDAYLKCWFRHWLQAHTAMEFWLFDEFTTRTLADGFTDDVYGAAYSPSLDLFCVVGQNGMIQTSPDGETWTTRTPDAGFAQDFYDVAWGNGKFMAVGDDTTTPRQEVQTSPDGVTWTQVTDPGGIASDHWARALCYANGHWILVGAAGDTAWSDDDGTTWHNVAGPGAWADDYNDVACNDNIIVAVGNSGAIHTSIDGGITWVETVSGLQDFVAVAWNGSFFCALSCNDLRTTSSSWVSADGLNWTEYDFPEPLIIDPFEYLRKIGLAVRYPNNLFAVAGHNETVFLSANGIDWISALEPEGVPLRSVVFGGSKCLVTGDSGSVVTSDITEDISA
jgi:uncharacterized protein YmfQ (DUF2313 family)